LKYEGKIKKARHCLAFSQIHKMIIALPNAEGLVRFHR
jgi:hypothetical protein